MLTGSYAQAFDSVAQVVEVQPVTETLNHPTQNCWTEYQQSTQYRPPEHHYGGAVVGGVVGGLLGSRFGQGNGKVAAAAVGAGVGAVAGDRIANRDETGQAYTTTVPVQRCEQVDHFETRITGYRVKYVYDNQQFATTLPYDPGNQLRVSVSVAPR